MSRIPSFSEPNMFENLRQAFREAVDNFNRELNRDEVPEVVDRLLHQMQEEVTDAKAQLHTLEEQIKRALQLSELEEKEAATCRRRESMADQIGDEETARVAREYAEKHERRKEIQENKALALREELEWKRREVDDMLAKIKEARTKREALSATAGRASARNSLGEAEDLFSELDRMAEKIEGIDRQREAEEDLLSEFEFDDSPPPPPRPSPEEEAEVRLRELKRRMGKD
ncbi:PspA/IM30 family protein [Gemmatimonadota bacterium]